ncbi:MAG: hypothetical protein IKP02_09445 [Paludibacteraceae bacterium]|nr:hypothetical protein [Paludibacteraceae bacterium]
MRKTFFFAMVLAASTLAFVACNDKKDKEVSEDQEQQYQVTIEDLLNTEWRIDSVYAGGAKQRPPHGLLRVISKENATFNGDTAAFALKEGKVVFRDNEYSLAAAAKGFAHVKSSMGQDIYLCQLPKLDMENLILEPKSEDFVGTWKLAYYKYDYHPKEGKSQYREGSDPWVETWEFKADGSAVYHDTFSGESKSGSWKWDFGLSFVKNPAEGTVIKEGEGITVQPLTKDWMGILRSPDGFQYYYWWFYRVK